MRFCGHSTRREFIKSSVIGGAATVAAMRYGGVSSVLGEPITTTSKVALTTGADRLDNVFRGLQMYKKEIAAAIGGKRVIVKPNVVIGTAGGWTPANVNQVVGKGDVALSTTNVDALEGVLEFLKSIGKTNVIIAEACATDPTMPSFENIGYFGLTRKYPVRLLDFNQEGYDIVNIYYGKATKAIRVTKVLSDPNNFVISVPTMKTHNNIVATLSLKNVAMGSPLIDAWQYDGRLAQANNDKSSMHGTTAPGLGAQQNLNDNLCLLAQRLAPDLAVIDGFRGMQGEGPCWGAPVDHKVAIVSLDWLAADRVGIELMQIPTSMAEKHAAITHPAYLTYCAQLGLGQYDLTKIIVEGEQIKDHQIKYVLNSTSVSQVANLRTTPPV